MSASASEEHRQRPPIPIRPFDAEAAASAHCDLAAWLAGCLGPAPQVVDRVVVAERPSRGAPLPVGEVAAAVDAGRGRAAAAAADGVTVLVGTGGAEEPGSRVSSALMTLMAGPLGILRRQGDAETALLCGLALGAGERGLAYVPDGPAAFAGAAVAIALEPSLRPRVRASDDIGRDLESAVAALREAAAGC
ncbi:MAG TPA: nicotinate-nucleotide--dimethylbenzimidazole phosphoribosyltransferase [Solirubrobacteraceae bacterium]|nr:nicotinate-nucleotide--dimethylbenzimidazole phosphoribosyltransferase [Solirubrobacteraceae bacterium]